MSGSRLLQKQERRKHVLTVNMSLTSIFVTPIINEHCSGLNILKRWGVLILRLTFSKEIQYSFIVLRKYAVLPYTDDTNQYINRYRLPLHLAFWTVYEYQTEYFDKIAITRLENVDVHHKPEKGVYKNGNTYFKNR